MITKTKGGREGDNGEKYKRSIFTKQNIFMILLGAAIMFGTQVTFDFTKGTISLGGDKRSSKLENSIPFTLDLKKKYDLTSSSFESHLKESKVRQEAIIDMIKYHEDTHNETLKNIRQDMREIRNILMKNN